MNRWPRVSIVTPSLNQSRFIRATIESIVSQDYPNFEYWVMDGGSTDGTIKILESYDGQIQWRSSPDSGQSQAVNKGWRLSQSEIVGWVNADDLLQPRAIQFAVDALMARTDIGAIYGNTDYIDEMGNFIQHYPVRQFDYNTLVYETENYIPQPSVFMRRAALEKVGYLNEALHYLMDYDLWLRLGLVAPMEYLPVDMAALRLHATAKTVKAMPRFASEFETVFQTLFSHPAFPASLQQDRASILHAVYIHSASFCFWGGDTRTARAYLAKAWTVQPFPGRRTFWLLSAFSMLGKTGWKLAELLHGNPMRLEKGLLTR